MKMNSLVYTNRVTAMISLGLLVINYSIQSAKYINRKYKKIRTKRRDE